MLVSIYVYRSLRTCVGSQRGRKEKSASEPTSVKPMNSECEVIKVLRLLSSPNFFFALAGSLELYVS